MVFIKPTIEYKQQVMEYKNEFITNGYNLAGASYLERYDVYEDWLKFVSDNEKESTKHTEVTANVYLAIMEEDNKLVGIINIRHSLNDYLYNYGGHIGYSVGRAERRKGYAKKMLKFALEECRKLGMMRVLLTCAADNIASTKTILSCGGILENEILKDGRVTQRYWIQL